MKIRTRRFQPLATLAFAYGMFRLWWFNRRAAKARARRLAEVAALASLSWLILALAVRGAFALAGV